MPTKDANPNITVSVVTPVEPNEKGGTGSTGSTHSHRDVKSCKDPPPVRDVTVIRAVYQSTRNSIKEFPATIRHSLHKISNTILDNIKKIRWARAAIERIQAKKQLHRLRCLWKEREAQSQKASRETPNIDKLLADLTAQVSSVARARSMLFTAEREAWEQKLEESLEIVQAAHLCQDKIELLGESIKENTREVEMDVRACLGMIREAEALCEKLMANEEVVALLNLRNWEPLRALNNDVLVGKATVVRTASGKKGTLHGGSPKGSPKERPQSPRLPGSVARTSDPGLGLDNLHSTLLSRLENPNAHGIVYFGRRSTRDNNVSVTCKELSTALGIQDLPDADLAASRRYLKARGILLDTPSWNSSTRAEEEAKVPVVRVQGEDGEHHVVRRSFNLSKTEPTRGSVLERDDEQRKIGSKAKTEMFQDQVAPVDHDSYISSLAQPKPIRPMTPSDPPEGRQSPMLNRAASPAPCERPRSPAAAHGRPMSPSPQKLGKSADSIPKSAPVLDNHHHHDPHGKLILGGTHSHKANSHEANGHGAHSHKANSHEANGHSEMAGRNAASPAAHKGRGGGHHQDDHHHHHTDHNGAHHRHHQEEHTERSIPPSARTSAGTDQGEPVAWLEYPEAEGAKADSHGHGHGHGNGNGHGHDHGPETIKPPKPPQLNGWTQVGTGKPVSGDHLGQELLQHHPAPHPHEKV